MTKQSMKQTLSAFIILCLLLSLGSSLAQAATPASPIKVFINGVELSLDTAPIIEGGRTLVPLRGIFEALQSSVVWDSKTQTVLATRAQTQIKIQIGNNKATKNNAQVHLDVPAKIINSRTYVPLRFIGESFGSNVTWDAKNRTVLVVDKNVSMNHQQFAEYVFKQFGSLQVNGITVQLDEVIVSNSEDFENEVTLDLLVDYENFLKLEQLIQQGKKAEIEAWLKKIGNKAQDNYAKKQVFGYLALYDVLAEKPVNLSTEFVQLDSSTSTYEVFMDIVILDNYEGFIELTWFQ